MDSRAATRSCSNSAVKSVSRSWSRSPADTRSRSRTRSRSTRRRPASPRRSLRSAARQRVDRSDAWLRFRRRESRASRRTTPVPLYWARVRPAERDAASRSARRPRRAPRLSAAADCSRSPTTIELVFYDQRGGGQSKTADRSADHLADARRRSRRGHSGAVARSGDARRLLVGRAARHALRDRGRPAARTTTAVARLVLLDPAPVNREYRRQFEAEFARRQNSETVAKLRADLAASGLRESRSGRVSAAVVRAERGRLFRRSVGGARPHAFPRDGSDSGFGLGQPRRLRPHASGATGFGNRAGAGRPRTPGPHSRSRRPRPSRARCAPPWSASTARGTFHMLNDPPKCSPRFDPSCPPRQVLSPGR